MAPDDFSTGWRGQNVSRYCKIDTTMWTPYKSSQFSHGKGMVAWMHGNSAWRHHFGFAKVARYTWADSKTLRQKLKFNLVYHFCENRVKILDSSMQTQCLVKFFSWSNIPLMPCKDIVMKKERGTIIWPSILPKYVPFHTTFYCKHTSSIIAKLTGDKNQYQWGNYTS